VNPKGRSSGAARDAWPSAADRAALETLLADTSWYELLIPRTESDPRAVRHVPRGTRKLQFCETIKDFEQRLGDPSVTLDSFIVWNTSSHTMRMFWGLSKDTMNQRNIVFQDEDQETYIASILGCKEPR